MADTSESERALILVDEMFVLLNWCEEQNLQPQQAAIVLQCALGVLKTAAESGSDWPRREDSFETFKDALLGAAVGADKQLLLPIDMLERVTEHISQAFYVRWKALQFAFTRPEGVEEVHLRVAVDTPMPKPPLSLGEPIGEITITSQAPTAAEVDAEPQTSVKSSKKSPRGSGRKK